MSIFNPVQSFVNMTNSWQQSMKEKANKKNTNQILADSQTLYQNGLNATDSKVKNSNMSASYLNNVAWAILTYAEVNGKYDEYANLQPSEIVSKFIGKNQWRDYDKYINMYTGGQMWFDELTRKIWINWVVTSDSYINPLDIEEEDMADFDPSLLTNFEYDEDDVRDTADKSSNNNALWWGVWGASLLWWTDIWLNYLWKGMQKWGRQLFNTAFTPSLKEESLISTQWGKVYEAKRAKNAAQTKLNEAKKAGVGIEEAQKEFDIASKRLEWLTNNKKITPTSQSAWENWLGSDWGMWWRAWWQRWRAAEAKWRAREIFTTKINKYIEESADTINVQEIINNLQNEINKVAGVHPWKKQVYGEALDSLREMFSWEEFKNLPVGDVQKLKEEIWSTTPQKFFNKKELANEYSELEWIFGTKLKDALHKSLTKTAWEDTAKLYLDYANLMDYATSQDRAATRWIRSWSSFKDLLVEPTSQKWGRLLYNTWKLLEQNTKWKWVKKLFQNVSEWIWNAWNYISKNWKNLFKATKWGLQVEDPVGIVELLQLVPWTIWDLADIAANSPAVAADTILYEVQWFKDAWNGMSDDERIEQIKSEYQQATWNELDDASAKATYENWKKKHKDGKYWLFDGVNDIEIILSA